MNISGEFQYNSAVPERPKSTILESGVEMISILSTGFSRFMAHWKIIVAGQVLSLLLTAAGAASTSMHIECNLSAPAAQSAVAYFFMSWHIMGTNAGASLRSWITETFQLSGERAVAPSMSNHNHKIWQHGLAKCRNLTYLWQRGTKSNSDVDLTINDGVNTKGLPPISPNPQGDAATNNQCNIMSLDKEYRCNPDQKLGLDLQPPQILRCLHHMQVSVPMWVYVLFAFIHVQANYLTYLAFRYTAITSVSLLDNLNIFSAMLCSIILLKRQYRKSHLLGAFICLIGVGLNLASDYQQSEINLEQIDDLNYQVEKEEYPQRLMGDLFAISGGLLVGLVDVLIEMLVKDFSATNEYIGMVGIFGFVLSIIQAGIFERDDVAKFFNKANLDMDVADEYEEYADPYDAPRTCSRYEGLLLLGVFVLTSYLFNVGTSRFLTISEAAFLTLSLLTGDLWAVSFTVIAEHVAPQPLFYLALITIVIGVVIYEIAPSPLENSHSTTVAKSANQGESIVES